MLLGRKCVQFKWFSPKTQYLDDVRLETTIFGSSRSSPKPDKIVGKIESGLTEVYCMTLFYSARLVSVTSKQKLQTSEISSRATHVWEITQKLELKLNEMYSHKPAKTHSKFQK